MNLDQVLAALTAGREEYELSPFFWTALHDVAAVRYRHEVLRDLERPDVRERIARFAETMRGVRKRLALADKLHYRLQKDSWFVDAVAVYCRSVANLSSGLAALELASDGLRALRAYLREYVASEGFRSLESETTAVREAIRGIRYRVCIQPPRVTVSREADDPDYSVEVLETFARFQQGDVGSYLVKLTDTREMNHVEANVLGLVAKLHPEPFHRRADYCGRRRGFLDPNVARFDREVQFYIAYLELIDGLRAAGLMFCYPDVTDGSKETDVTETFDIALASKLVRDGRSVVCNDLRLGMADRVFVVSGPNNGGKTTFARTVGQLHHLGSLGLLVPGRTARLFLQDQIFTHFERDEDIETLRGKFDAELVRVHEILRRATSSSLIVLNESFSSTALTDALFVGTEVLTRILERDCLGVYVTFVDELASLSPATVSMVAEVSHTDPAQRTFKVRRKPADGIAHAWAIAEKHGLTYERLVERIGP